MDELSKETIFRYTLELARKGWGRTHPNPMVGAIILEGGEITAQGYHRQAGDVHAEVDVLRNLGRSPRSDASMFVSLEPCSTTGRTPPCVEAIIKSGIKNVFVGTTDPNPSHAGRGLDLLRTAGINVELSDIALQRESTRLNFIFNHNMKTQRPLLALKMAETSNGMLAEVRGRPSRITEDRARSDMMNWRRLFPAIAIGSGSVLADDPSLTARLPNETFCPVRLVLDSSLITLGKSIPCRKLYTDEFSSRTKVLTTSKGLGNSPAIERAKELGVSLIEVGGNENGQVEMFEVLKVLKDLNLNSLYCEGGAKVAQALLEKGLLDYLFRYQSPKLFSGPDALPGPDLDSLTLRETITAKLGEDRLSHGFL